VPKPTHSKLSIPRATRLNYAAAIELDRVSKDTGMVPSQVDREILTRIAELLRENWESGESLRHWVQGIHFRHDDVPKR
jgi:hypothetical protein